MPGEGEEKGEDLKAAIRRAISALNDSQDRPGYFNLYDSNSLQVHGFPPNLPSKFEGMRMFYDALWRAFPDSYLVIDDLIVEGDKAVSRYTFTGTQMGEFMGIPPSGKRVKLSGMTILRFDQSSSSKKKCIERWNMADMMGLMQQIGAIPSAP
jgi:predicted ester cyclase